MAVGSAADDMSPERPRATYSSASRDEIPNNARPTAFPSRPATRIGLRPRRSDRCPHTGANRNCISEYRVKRNVACGTVAWLASAW